MQNFILNNGVILKTIAPITFVNNLSKTRTLAFVTDIPYDQLFNILSDYGNICKILCAFENGKVVDTLTDCVKLKVLSRKDDGTFTAEFSTDATEKLILELQEKVKRLESQIDALTAVKEPEPEKPEIDPEENSEPDPTENTDLSDENTDIPELAIEP